MEECVKRVTNQVSCFGPDIMNNTMEIKQTQPYLGSLLPHAGFRRALVRCIASPEQTKATTNTVVKPLKKTVLLPIMILLTVVPVLACVLDQSESATQMLHLSPTYQYENRATCFHV